MLEQTARAPAIRSSLGTRLSDAGRSTRHRGARRSLLLLVPLVVVLASAVFVEVSGMLPGYDGYGWVVWGHQALHLNLDTNGAPSWKPLTFLFTLPFALTGRGAVWLWMVTAVAGGFASVWFAARLAYRLTAPSSGRRYAPLVAGAFAGAGVLGLDSYSQQTLIANSDLLVVALCLAAIDCHLSKRFRLAFILIVLAGLGRPEAWPFVGLYAAWAWRAVPSMRILAVAGVAAIPIFWFGIPGLTSKSWLRAGDLALNSPNALHGNKIVGVIGRFDGLNVLPVQLAALCGLALALARRDRATVLVAAAAVLWVAIEIAFALHGWSAVPRYMYEAGAVVVVVAGTGVGRLLATAESPRAMVRWIGPVAVVILVAALVPTARHRERVLGRQVIGTKNNTRLLNGIPNVIARLGGASTIKSCGKPVSFLGYQSILGLYLDLNVGNVGYKPGREIGTGQPIVVFRPNGLGWTVRPVHIPAADRARCSSLSINVGPR
jgi:hypothetical protein